MHDEIDIPLPWYVNRTLGEFQRAEVARHLRTDPALRNELLFWEEVAAGQCRLPAVAEDIALQRTLERIRRESAGAIRRPRQPGWFARIWPQPGAWLRPALACAIALVVVQSVVLLRRHEDDATRMRGATPAATTAARSLPARTALLRVVFDPATTEGEIRVLVGGHGGSIVGGPGDGGEYYVAVPDQRVIVVTDALRASTAIREVAGVDALPRMR